MPSPSLKLQDDKPSHEIDDHACDESCANYCSHTPNEPQFMLSHSQGRASNPASVSAGSSSCISIKFIDLSFSKWDGLSGDNFQRLALMSRRVQRRSIAS